MDLLSFILFVVVVGLIVWVVNTYLPIPEPFKMVILVVAIIVVLVVLVRAIGFSIPIPQLRH